MRNLIINLIKKIPLIGEWKSASDKYHQLHAIPGEYNSPIVTHKEAINNGYQPNFKIDSSIEDVNLNTHGQEELLKQLIPYFGNFPFPKHKDDNYRYYFDNHMFSYPDGTLLFAILNQFKPKRIIEIGSGFSSALTVDTFEKVIKEPINLIFIDPYTDRVDKLLSSQDQLNVEFIRVPVQKLPLSKFDDLNSGDILFIDSSHIVKTSSDLNYIFFEILPKIKSGVLIHIHDIFFPFEYPEEWIKIGFCFNEAYFLRAFLMNNPRYEIIYWNDFMIQKNLNWFKMNYPHFLDNKGGSIWLRKI